MQRREESRIYDTKNMAEWKRSEFVNFCKESDRWTVKNSYVESAGNGWRAVCIIQERKAS